MPEPLVPKESETAAPQTLTPIPPEKPRSLYRRTSDKLQNKEIQKGIGLLMLCHLVWLFNPFLCMILWAFQLVYAVPILVFLGWKKKTVMAQGVLIGMTFTFLADTIYCGFLATGGFHK